MYRAIPGLLVGHRRVVPLQPVGEREVAVAPVVAADRHQLHDGAAGGHEHGIAQPGPMGADHDPGGGEEPTAGFGLDKVGAPVPSCPTLKWHKKKATDSSTE